MKKGYERIYAEINLDNVRFNLQSMKNTSAPKGGYIAVIKADGYGHGAIEIAREVEDLVWGFAVATPDEGISLRKQGVTKPILLLGYVSTERFDEMVEYEIRLPLYEEEKVRILSEAAGKLGKPGYVHIKVDTGMGRIGLFPDQTGIETVEKMVGYDNVVFEGLFTHLATADMQNNYPAIIQKFKFIDFRDNLLQKGIKFEYCHYANSATSMVMENQTSDLCRIGISLYGLYPSDELDWRRTPIKPVMSLYSMITFVKTVPYGSAIGYGGTFTTNRESVIATVSAGYADGYPRTLSNKASVLLHGHRVPIVGRICMDQFMVDVTDLVAEGFKVAEGDRITLIGTDGSESITMEELGNISGRFNYELACDITKRVPRVFMKNGVEISSRDYFEA